MLIFSFKCKRNMGMKKMFLLSLAAIFYYPSAAQKVTVEEYVTEDQNGYQVFLEKEPETVANFLDDYFKSYGKVKYRNNIYTLSQLNHMEFPFPEVEVYSQLRNKDDKTKALVWLPDSVMEQEVYASKLKSLWYIFAIDFYKHLKQQEINESLRALNYAEKQFQRLEKDSLGLQKDLEKNSIEKAKLEEELKINELNHKVLLQKIENNSAAQDSILVTLEKIRRLIELQEKEKKAIE